MTLTSQCPSVAPVRVLQRFRTERTRCESTEEGKGKEWAEALSQGCEGSFKPKKTVALLLPCSSREGKARRNWGNSYAPQ